MASHKSSKKNKKAEESESGSEPEGEEYEVEEILGVKISKGKKLYHVKWKGYPLSDATWEPKENLGNAPKLLIEFEKRMAQKGNKEDQDQDKKKSLKKKKAEDSGKEIGNCHVN